MRSFLFVLALTVTVALSPAYSMDGKMLSEPTQTIDYNRDLKALMGHYKPVGGGANCRNRIGISPDNSGQADGTLRISSLVYAEYDEADPIGQQAPYSEILGPRDARQFGWSSEEIEQPGGAKFRLGIFKTSNGYITFAATTAERLVGMMSFKRIGTTLHAYTRFGQIQINCLYETLP